ncbi:MAG: acyl-CoA dehydratase activase [Coriobacteriia bacterium]|nr:acyl-CoA dehydratase activase [Coriobacteriia bacterium]
MGETTRRINVGIDVGSTTTKLVAIDACTHARLFAYYGRHQARQVESVLALLEQLEQGFPGALFRAAICGSGGLSLAEALGLPYAQEVVANAIAIHEHHPATKVAIELGGQDAKIVFFAPSDSGELQVANLRMNGVCAGGTGAFIDEVAALLSIPVESFEGLASQGRQVFEISGRCGVFAKTDIQPLLNRAVPKEDIALSTLHAIAKQTICGLAQGLDIEAPVAFMGGPTSFIPTLVTVFAEHLGLKAEDIVIPDQPETVIALGAALSLDTLFKDEPALLDLDAARQALSAQLALKGPDPQKGAAFFSDDEEYQRFCKRHAPSAIASFQLAPGQAKRAFLGIDSGSTTTKYVLIDTEGEPFESFCTANKGEPLERTIKALCDVRDKYRDAGTPLEILGVGTTGYGEELFARALCADYQVVETVAHARAAREFVPDLSFLVDIGGQDMKALWIDNGVITGIVVNEACSSGCGSFLENYATSFGVPVEDIATLAFGAQSPAELGSRCTVFMNSSIVTQMRNGRTQPDIMAGLCRSIVENVFTKVIRTANLDSLGPRIVVQGGVFKNDAVLRAFESYVGKEVTRSPYPDLMGALGVALLTREQWQKRNDDKNEQDGCLENRELAAKTAKTAPTAHAEGLSTFIGLEALDGLSYTQETGLVCEGCSNRCVRSRITFSNGRTWVTGNRCAKGEDPSGADGATEVQTQEVPDLFKERERLLFGDYPVKALAPKRAESIGLPCVLAFWELMPFWKAFFSSLGFTVILSKPSSHRQYQAALPAVTSDTACFPAKLVHGHIRDLVQQGVDRIFLPAITTPEWEGPDKSEESLCALVKGTPLIIKNSDDPSGNWGVPYDAPLFHWFSKRDRARQLASFMQECFGIAPAQTRKAIAQGDAAQALFTKCLLEKGKAVIEEVEKNGSYAVVLAGRPYHGDALVNHGISSIFTELGIPVLSADSIPGWDKVDLSKSRLDLPNTYLSRILASCLLAVRSPHLEFVQLVSFGCGHDAYLSDEVIRLMKEVDNRAPLIVKIDESDTREPLRIRVRSFIETIALRRGEGHRAPVHALSEPYPAKLTRSSRKKMTVLLPNTSHAFSRLMAAVFNKQGLHAISLAYGQDEAVRLGKMYVHNDMCFPVQVVVGEVLEALSSGQYDLEHTAVAIARYTDCCRLAFYCAMLRKALDDAGFHQVPIVTNDDIDIHALHPGFKMSKLSLARIATTLPLIDVLEELLRKIRPYEVVPGSTQTAYEAAFDLVMQGVEAHGMRGARSGFRKALEVMGQVAYDRSTLRPRVHIMGEFLMSFHPGANNRIESYLEGHGFELSMVRITDMIHKIYFSRYGQIKDFSVSRPLSEKLWYAVVNAVFKIGNQAADRLAVRHPLHEPIIPLTELVKASDPIIHHSFDTSEGVLTPAEILYKAARGEKAFIILQPFGCLPNHIVGRGIAKRIKQLYPNIQILALDFDPDTSPANIENRLQMLITNSKATRKQGEV